MFNRSTRPEVFCKKSILGNFAKFTGKQLCQSLFFNKVAGQACNFIKKETLAQAFSFEFCEISKNTFSYRTPPAAASRSTFKWIQAFILSAPIFDTMMLKKITKITKIKIFR